MLLAERTFWVFRWGKVPKQVLAYQSAKPDYWYVPELGYEVWEGGLYETREAAIQAEIEQIEGYMKSHVRRLEELKRLAAST